MFAIQGYLSLALSLILFGVKLFALVDCVARKPAAFVDLTQLSKPAWLTILGLSVAAHAVFWSPLGILNLAGTVAAFVYLAQIRGSRY